MTSNVSGWQPIKITSQQIVLDDDFTKYSEADDVSVNAFYVLNQADFDWQVKNYGEGEYLNEAKPGDVVWFDGELFCDQTTVKGYELQSYDKDEYEGAYGAVLHNWPLAPDTKQTTRNPFTPTGIEKLDRSIDNLADDLKAQDQEVFTRANNQLQGIRTTLVAIDNDRFNRTANDISSLISDCIFSFAE